MAKLDKNYKCSRALKTTFALLGLSRSQRKDLMIAEAFASTAERAVVVSSTGGKRKERGGKDQDAS